MPYYGQNGFYLPFKNNANTTSLGFDYSGSTYARYNATAFGNAVVSTTQSKFGGASALFDGNGDYLEIPYTSAFEVGSADYTVECWIKTANAGMEIVGAFNSASPYYGWLFQVTDNAGYVGKLGFWNANNSNNEIKYSTATVNNNAWRHVAVTKSGTTLRFFIDGNLDSTHTLSYVGTGSNQNIVIGAASNSPRNRFFNGNIDDLRIYKGIAKYTTNFTPPTSALPLGKADPNWQYCSLAMPMDGDNNSTVFPVYAPFNWTPNNFSVTAGAGNDSLIDVPTRYADGGNNRGNYCVLNPLDKGSEATLANGNCDITWSGTNGHAARATFGIERGKWYWEVAVGANSSVGLIAPNIYPSLNTWPGNSAYGATGSYAYAPNGQKVNNSVLTNYGSAMSNGNIVGVAYDADNGALFFSLNGTWQASGDPAAGTNAAFTGITGTYCPAIGYWQAPTTNVNSFNFGQRAFAYTPPAGFKALNTYNLNVQGNLPQLSVEYLVVAGGGGSGGTLNNSGGHGDGGQVQFGTTSLALGSSFFVNVGTGGSAGSGWNGTSSTSGTNSILATITSLGGKGGANSFCCPGASAGGTGGTGLSSAGTQVATGENNVALGIASNITGTSLNYGNAYSHLAINVTPGAQVANRGHGAFAVWSQTNRAGGPGGSGIVILRFPSTYNITVSAGLTYSQTTVSGNKVVQFTAGTGTVTFS